MDGRERVDGVPPRIREIDGGIHAEGGQDVKG